jgi:hypothetical protein
MGRERWIGDGEIFLCYVWFLFFDVVSEAILDTDTSLRYYKNTFLSSCAI